MYWDVKRTCSESENYKSLEKIFVKLLGQLRVQEEEQNYLPCERPDV